jgi:HK97 family phage prohead protease
VRTETRIVRGEVRAVGMTGKAMRVSGMAARYNNPTVIQQGRTAFKEILLPGAFRKAVYAKQDTAFLINHDPNKLLGRVSSGTLRLQDTADGLHFECDFPDTEAARDAYASIQRGDMHGCSFKFATEPGDDEWSVERKADKAVAVRKIRNVAALDDVSAVTFPAYPNTSVNARSGFGDAHFEFENRSSIVIPAGLVVDEDEIDEVDSVEAIARRRQLLNIALL